MKHKTNRGQIGGEHYAEMPIDVIEFCHVNNIPFNEGNVIKYVCRWRNKNGIEDLKKARNFLDRIINIEVANKIGDKLEVEFNKPEYYVRDLKKAELNKVIKD